MFGLTNAEGNHGEDVKEYDFYVDATPTSSYLRHRYSYPPVEYPYADLVATNRARGRLDMEYELIDTGVFDGDQYVHVDTIHDPRVLGVNGRRMLAVVDEAKLRRLLERMLDENEFLGPHGLRALSRVHADHPYEFDVHGQRYEVRYLPAESDSGMFGGNSNWRGPVWFPVNYLVPRGLLHLYSYYGDDFTVECPTRSGRQCTLFQVALELGGRLVSTFLPDTNGRRPVFGGTERFRTDPEWKDRLLFYEYFHGDNGAGLGASHQTGWTGLVARIIQVSRYLQPEDLLASGLHNNLVHGRAPAAS